MLVGLDGVELFFERSHTVDEVFGAGVVLRDDVGVDHFVLALGFMYGGIATALEIDEVCFEVGASGLDLCLEGSRYAGSVGVTAVELSIGHELVD